MGGPARQGSDVFEGFAQYPLNLAGFDALLENGAGYRDDLKELSPSLFDPDRINLQVIDASSK